MIAQVIDANINRVSEGLRVIEEYTRFVAGHHSLTVQLSELRKSVNRTETAKLTHLHSRETGTDTRAKEPPAKRTSIKSVLIANFKRVQEGLRVLEEYTGNVLYNQYRYDVYMLEKTILLLVNKPPIKEGVYLVSDDLDVLEQGLKWGCSLVQLRDKFATKEQLFNKANALKKLASQYNVPWIINDYLDIALLLDSDGIHTGQDDLSLHHIRKLMGDHKLVGRTTHSIEQGKQAEESGADYVSVGPIWDTPSKPNRSGIGFDYLSVASSELNIPFVAIGGINDANISEVMAFSPPMVGVIRDYRHVPKWQQQFWGTKA